LIQIFTLFPSPVSKHTQNNSHTRTPKVDIHVALDRVIILHRRSARTDALDARKFISKVIFKLATAVDSRGRVSPLQAQPMLDPHGAPGMTFN